MRARTDMPTPLGAWNQSLSVLVLVATGVLLLLGVAQSIAAGDIGPLVARLVFVGLLVALVGPLELMQRTGRGVAAPMGTAESTWSMVAFAGVIAVAAGAGAAWALGAGHTGFAIALGACAALGLVGVVGALIGPAESMRGLRPGEVRRTPDASVPAAPSPGAAPPPR